MNNNILAIIGAMTAAGLVSCAPPPPNTYSGAKSGIPSAAPGEVTSAHDWGPFGTGERRDRVLLVPHHDPHHRGRPGDDRVLLREDARTGGGLREVETLRRE